MAHVALAGLGLLFSVVSAVMGRRGSYVVQETSASWGARCIVVCVLDGFWWMRWSGCMVVFEPI